MNALLRLFSSRPKRFVVFMKCTRRGKLPRQDDYATNYSAALSSQWAFQFHTFQIFSLRLFILSVSFVQLHTFFKIYFKAS